MNFKTIIASLIAAAVLSSSPVLAAAKMTKSYDKDVKGRMYHFVCYMKKKDLEACGNWKIFK